MTQPTAATASHVVWIVLIWRESPRLPRWEVLDFECNEGYSGPFLTRDAAEAERDRSLAWFAGHSAEPRIIVAPLEVPVQ